MEKKKLSCYSTVCTIKTVIKSFHKEQDLLNSYIKVHSNFHLHLPKTYSQD